MIYIYIKKKYTDLLYGDYWTIVIILGPTEALAVRLSPGIVRLSDKQIWVGNGGNFWKLATFPPHIPFFLA